MEEDFSELPWEDKGWLINRQTTDLHEHARFYDRWDMEIVQLSAGRFTGRLFRIDCPHMQIFREYSNLTLLKTGNSWAGSVIFSLPIHAAGSGWMCGAELKDKVSLLEDGTLLNEMVTPSHLDVVFIALDRNWFMAQALERGFTQIAHALQFTHSFSLQLTQQACLSAFFERFLSDVCRNDLKEAPQFNFAAIENLVAAQLLHALSDAYRVAHIKDTERKRIADAARQIFLQNLCEPLGFGDIARQLGISRRHLHNCFMSSFGVSGYQLLQAMRLNKVRFELLMSRKNNRRVSIGDVASEWGFWHQSRFAADYVQIFYELPSQTLNGKTAP